MRKFQIKGDDSKLFFWVHVFETTDDANDWVGEYNRKAGKDQEGRFGAICMPFEWIRVDSDGNEERKPNIGIVVLSEEQLTLQTIVHELAHCSFWHDRLTGNDNAVYGPVIGAEEEKLLYLLAEYTRTCFSKLEKLGYKVEIGSKILKNEDQ